MKQFVFCLVLCLFSHQVFAGPFKLLYTDSAGLKWGEGGPTNLANGCRGPNGSQSKDFCLFERDEYGNPISYGTYYEVQSESSDAAQYCRSIGARLPRATETIRLIKEFEHTDLPVRPFPILTDRGRADLIEIFSDIKNSDGYLYPFWTSSITKDSFWGGPLVIFAYFFSPSEGSLNSIGRSKNHGIATRCVQD